MIIKEHCDMCFNGCELVDFIRNNVSYWKVVDNKNKCEKCDTASSRRSKYCPECGAKMVNVDERN